MFGAFKIKDPGEGWIAVILPGKGGLQEGKGSGRQNSVSVREALLQRPESKSLVTAEVKTKGRQSRQVERGICEPVGGREEGMGRLGRTTLGPIVTCFQGDICCFWTAFTRVCRGKQPFISSHTYVYVKSICQ